MRALRRLLLLRQPHPFSGAREGRGDELEASVPHWNVRGRGREGYSARVLRRHAERLPTLSAISQVFELHPRLGGTRSEDWRRRYGRAKRLTADAIRRGAGCPKAAQHLAPKGAGGPSRPAAYLGALGFERPRRTKRATEHYFACQAMLSGGRWCWARLPARSAPFEAWKGWMIGRRGGRGGAAGTHPAPPICVRRRSVCAAETVPLTPPFRCVGFGGISGRC